MKKSELEIPANLQPDPDDYAYDLERALRAVVGLKSYVPSDAFTATSLGEERAGNGVVIRESGLVVTIGYLITEAETVWLTASDGRAIPGHALAYDGETGFGLVQALGRLDLPALEIGDSDRVKVGDHVVFAAAGGRHYALETRVVGRQEFPGYWEYLLDDAFFTAPSHPFWGGGALLGPDGKLLGVGSLILQQGDGRGNRLDMNMIVPIGHLTPILDELLSYGRVNRPARPWLGMHATESDDEIVVCGVSDGGPADKAGIRQGDRVVSVGGEEITDLSGLWRRIWASGSAGAEVRLRLIRDRSVVPVTVKSADRASFLKSPGCTDAVGRLQVAVVPVTAFQQNCSLLWDAATMEGVVVDPGGDVDRILAAIARAAIRPTGILLTHGHLDHAGGAAELKEALERSSGGPVPIEGPDERDRFLLDGLEQQAAGFGLPGVRNVTPDRWLREGDTVGFAGHEFLVLHCPGHTPGHVVFVNHVENFALLGDVLFQGSIGRTDFPYGNTGALLQAIERKLLPLDERMAFICGHGPGSTIGAEKRGNPFLRRAN